MASSASAPSPNPPLSPEDDDREPRHTGGRGGGHRNRKRKVDRNSSSSPTNQERRNSSSRRKFLNSRTIRENRIYNFSLDHNTTSYTSSDEEEERVFGVDDSEKEKVRKRQQKGRSRIRKANRITSSFIGGREEPIREIPLLQLPLGIYSDIEERDDDDHDDDRKDSKVKDSTLSSFHLKWDEQLSQIGSEVQTFFENGTFSDVSLICILDEEEEEGRGGVMVEDEIRIRAHQIILASFSQYFKKLLEENPCKNPMILLKGFTNWEVQTLIEFMYKGILNIRLNQVDNLLRAADSLQIRGVRECLAQIRELDDGNNKPQAIPSCHNNEDVKCHEGAIGGRESPKLLNLSMSGGSREDGLESRHERSRNGPQTTTVHHPGFSIQHHQNPSEQQSHSAASPPFPRRKQARPRRRSGDFIAQDLRVTLSSPPQPTIPLLDIPSSSIFSNIQPLPFSSLRNGNEDERELEGEGVLDFTMSQLNVKNNNNNNEHRKRIEDELFAGLGQGLHNQYMMKNWPLIGLGLGSGPIPKMTNSPMRSEELTPSPPLPRNEVALLENQLGKFNHGERSNRRRGGRGGIIPNGHGHGHGGMVFKTSPPSSPFLMNFSSTNGHGHPQSDSESNNTETCSTPPTVFSPAGFPQHPHNQPSGKKGNNNSSNDSMGGQQQQQQPWPGLQLGPAPIFGRHRAQHSAPRGGPPRAWSNADLTEALHNVWNKKMTTSQASRIFGIPYNSLLMYVRGKYGKSLKLDVLKKGLESAMENTAAANAAAAAKNNNSTKSKGSTPPSRRSTSPNSLPSPRNSTPPHNNNNITKGNSKGNSPQPTLNLTTLLSQGLTGTQSPPEETIRGIHHKSPESNNQQPPLGDILSPGFNPFSVGMFSEYPPPFPFPSAVAAANAALSHILPPHHPHSHHHLINNSHRRIHHATGSTDK